MLGALVPGCPWLAGMSQAPDTRGSLPGALTCPVQTQRLQDVGPGELDPQCGDVKGQGSTCSGLVPIRRRWGRSALPTPALHREDGHQAVDEVQLRSSDHAGQRILEPEERDSGPAVQGDTDTGQDIPQHTLILA